MTDLPAIFSELKSLLQGYSPPLTPKVDTETSFDLWSQKDLVIEGRKRKEVYFAGLIIQKSYVGFYFMPVYVETEMRTFFPPELLRHLKGKSCFHIKTLTPELREQIRAVLQSGFELYQQRGWV